MAQEKLKGTCRISRWTGGGEPGTGVTISLIDEISRSECVEIHISVEALGMLITGSQQDCEFEWRPKNVGLLAENKTEIVKWNFTNKRGKEMDKALAPYEVDGWHARRSDMENHHHSVDRDHQKVVFFRHVDPVTKQPR